MAAFAPDFTPNRRDRRDPTLLGQALLALPRRLRKLSDRYDRHRVEMRAVPAYVDTESSLERYGDPVAQHEAKIAAGLAVRLP